MDDVSFQVTSGDRQIKTLSTTCTPLKGLISIEGGICFEINQKNYQDNPQCNLMEFCGIQVGPIQNRDLK